MSGSEVGTLDGFLLIASLLILRTGSVAPMVGQQLTALTIDIIDDLSAD